MSARGSRAGNTWPRSLSRWGGALAAGGLVALGVPPAAAARQRAFTPAADAYVTSAKPRVNFGARRTLKVGSPSRRIYLRFDVRLPTGATVKAAKLRLYTTSASSRRGYQAYAVSNTRWRETTVNRRNAPALGARLGTSGRWSTVGYKTVTLPTGYVHPGLNSIGVATTSRRAIRFRSDEARTHKPRLVVRYALPAPLSGARASGPASGARASGTGAPLVPASGVLFGAWHKDSTTGRWTQSSFAAFESLVGRKMRIDHRYAAWGSAYWPGADESWDVVHGRIPMISLGGSSPQFPGLDAIRNGAQDGYIKGLADRVKAFGSRLFLRPLYEMNGDWFPWGGKPSSSAGTTNGPLKYVQAWRRMHEIFVSRGATNAVWVWSPDCYDHPATAWNHWSAYYPGDSYVDWVGCDAYNWGNTESWSKWTSWASLFGTARSVYADYLRKPFMVPETGSCEQGGNKAAWFTDTARAIKTSFPNVKAFLYLDEFKERAINCDWRVNSSPAALSGYRTFAHDPYFQG